MKCQVCELNKAKGVACSPLGPISIAYCQTCLQERAEPEWLLESIKGPSEVQLASWVLELKTFKDGKYVSAREVLSED